jgi:NitT/TauT family transport system substrate-binding protein
VTLKSSNLNKPTDLNGKKIAGGPGTAVHDTFPILLKSAKMENVKVNWVAVQPQLFAPMLVRKEVDGMGGFINSQIPALLDLGIPLSDIHPIKYADFGVDLYGLTLVTLKKYADENVDVVKGVVAGLNKGTIDTLKDPQAALNILKKKDSMMKDSVEKVRLDIAIGLTLTKWVQKNGMSVAQPERMKKMIALIVDTYGLKKTQTPESEYSDKYLPPLSERQIN